MAGRPTPAAGSPMDIVMLHAQIAEVKQDLRDVDRRVTSSVIALGAKIDDYGQALNDVRDEHIKTTGRLERVADKLESHKESRAKTEAEVNATKRQYIAILGPIIAAAITAGIAVIIHYV